MYVYKHRLKDSKTLCCSMECSYKVRSLPNVVCAFCGIEFHRKQSYILRTGLLCCSRKCLSELRKIIYKGEGNSRYGKRGLSNPACKEKRITSSGYVDVYSETHPFRNSDNRIKEHRLVAEEYLLTDENSVEVDGKKYLNPNLVVHHKDRDRTNNDPDNLQIMTKSEHSRHHNPPHPNNN